MMIFGWHFSILADITELFANITWLFTFVTTIFAYVTSIQSDEPYVQSYIAYLLTDKPYLQSNKSILQSSLTWYCLALLRFCMAHFAVKRFLAFHLFHIQATLLLRRDTHLRVQRIVQQVQHTARLHLSTVLAVHKLVFFI